MSTLTERHPNSQKFHDYLKKMGELHDKKQMDYGNDTDPFHNVRGAQEFGVKPWIGAMIRMNDKIRRIQSFIRRGRLENEPLEDSLLDIAVYAIIALILWEEERKGESPIKSMPIIKGSNQAKKGLF